MGKNQNNKQQNNSMFLYTALIFVVALILIILAFFGQTNLSNLRKTTEQAIVTESEPTVEETEITASEAPDDEAIAKMTNTISALDSENKSLKDQLSTYDNLSEAAECISNDDKESAKAILEKLDENTLTDNQKILYNQILNKIN